MPKIRNNPVFILLSMIILLVGGCNDTQAANAYSKDGVSFKVPKNWAVLNDSQMFDERKIVVQTNGTSLVTIEYFSKPLLEREPEHKIIATSLKRYANNFNKRDITAKLQTPQPIAQETVQRDGHTGLKETQKFIIANKINETSVREYYRLDTKDEVVFITMDTSADDYKKISSGFDTILNSFKYHDAK
jgi:hypothetical protein